MNKDDITKQEINEALQKAYKKFPNMVSLEDKEVESVVNMLKDFHTKEQYFEPDLKDIRIGYECEVAYNMGAIWKSIILDRDSVYEYTDESIFLNEIRVPYLTKEQIEAEGWKFKGTISSGEGDNSKYSYTFQKIIEDIHYNVFTGKDNISIWKWSSKERTSTLFRGQCKDINTFRYIIKLLGI